MKLGATRHRSAEEALRGCRRSPQTALAAFEAIAKRRDLILNRDKTRVTRVTEGCEFLGFNFVKRLRPRSGQHPISLLPAKSAHQKMRHKLQYLTSRRAPLSPPGCVGLVNPLVTGGVNYFRHTNASNAFRGLQRFVNIRVRRSLPQRSTGRGFGGKR